MMNRLISVNVPISSGLRGNRWDTVYVSDQIDSDIGAEADTDFKCLNSYMQTNR